MLKSGIEIKQGEIVELFEDEDAVSIVNAYTTWKRTQSLPYSGTARCPYWLIQAINSLKPIDEFYNPPKLM